MAMDAKQVGSALNSIAYGQAMVAAVRDYVKETEDEQAEAAARANAAQGRFDVDDLLDDPELQALHEERLAKLKAEAERRAELERKGHGRYEEVTEGDFLEVVTKTERVVAHFFHRDFERCKIVDAHLPALARRFPDTRFIKVSAPDAPFFTVKLNIKVLPAVVFFRGGTCVGRVVGFDALGGRDDFSTAALERAMRACGVVQDRRKGEGDEDDDDEENEGRGRAPRLAAQVKMGGTGAVRTGGGGADGRRSGGGGLRRGGNGGGGGGGDDDESSDFD